ncbi:unnamed protein product [Citrullus colocynthis]|uniref:Uncharacterized protein n=1 Tax=Citrullus colocynthis TaxID=252529 RepID=A0ABP0YP32_9ROSI
MRNKSESEFHSSLPAGFLFRGRKQGHPFLFLHRLHQVQARERGQAPTILRDPQLLGNPAQTDQAQVQFLWPSRRLYLRRWASSYRQSSEFQILQSDMINREETHCCTIVRRHITNGGSVS